MQTIQSVFKWPLYSCQSTLCSPASTDCLGPLLFLLFYWQNKYLHSEAPRGVWCVCAGRREGGFRQLTYVGTAEQQPLSPLQGRRHTRVNVAPSQVVGFLVHLHPALQGSTLGGARPPDSVHPPGHGTLHMETLHHHQRGGRRWG